MVILRCIVNCAPLSICVFVADYANDDDDNGDFDNCLSSMIILILGNEMERARDLFYALWIPDLFMKRIEQNGTWSCYFDPIKPKVCVLYCVV